MIEFVPGPHGQVASASEKAKITAGMSPTSMSYYVNQVYNNPHHFSSPQFQYDPNTFLRELLNMIDSQFHKVEVMGGIHSDPFGHSSGLIGQQSPYGDVFPVIVKDTYVRFRIKMHQNYVKALRALDTVNTFHFLMQVPDIVKVQFMRVPVKVYITDHRFLPRSEHYKSLTYETAVVAWGHSGGSSRGSRGSRGSQGSQGSPAHR